MPDINEKEQITLLKIPLMRSFGLWLLISCLFITKLDAQAHPLSSDVILKEAYQQASKEKKNVFILFHASWCGWCHKMDTSMNDLKVKNFFTDNYVIRHLVVYESNNKKQLENPGALELLKKYKGDDQGIPYWFIFDKDGKLLADSKLRHGDDGDNSGGDGGGGNSDDGGGDATARPGCWTCRAQPPVLHRRPSEFPQRWEWAPTTH